MWEGRALTFYITCRKPCFRVPLASPGLSNWASLLISSVFWAMSEPNFPSAFIRGRKLRIKWILKGQNKPDMSRSWYFLWTASPRAVIKKTNYNSDVSKFVHRRRKLNMRVRAVELILKMAVNIKDLYRNSRNRFEKINTRMNFQ